MNRKGMSLIECVVALAIMALVVIGGMRLYDTSSQEREAASTTDAKIIADRPELFVSSKANAVISVWTDTLHNDESPMEIKLLNQGTAAFTVMSLSGWSAVTIICRGTEPGLSVPIEVVLDRQGKPDIVKNKTVKLGKNARRDVTVRVRLSDFGEPQLVVQ